MESLVDYLTTQGSLDRQPVTNQATLDRYHACLIRSEEPQAKVFWNLFLQLPHFQVIINFRFEDIKKVTFRKIYNNFS
jgi:hypothetical protein